MTSNNTITPAMIDALLAFLPGFERPDATFVERWETQSGAFPYPVYAEDVRSFFLLAGRPAWCDYDYDPQRAGKMLQSDSSIAAATLDEIRTMLTFCVRGERFSDGHWEHMLKEGRIQALLRRLADIRKAASHTP